MARFRGFYQCDTRVSAGTAIACVHSGRAGDVMGIARRTSTYVGVALLGGMVGAIFGLLVAPGPGGEIRRRMARQSIEDQERLLRLAEMGSDLLTDDFDLAASA
jgi:hypothetical protein